MYNIKLRKVFKNQLHKSVKIEGILSFDKYLCRHLKKTMKLYRNPTDIKTFGVIWLLEDHVVNLHYNIKTNMAAILNKAFYTPIL